MDGHVIVRAVKHPANYKPIIFCSISLVAVGSIMVILGIVIMLIDHVEMGPPHFDPLYERYEGSSLASVMGPMFIGFGTFIILGNIFMLCYATRSYHQSTRHQANIECANIDHQNINNRSGARVFYR